jgi:hypothetical protein
MHKVNAWLWWSGHGGAGKRAHRYTVLYPARGLRRPSMHHESHRMQLTGQPKKVGGWLCSALYLFQSHSVMGHAPTFSQLLFPTFGS